MKFNLRRLLYATTATSLILGTSRIIITGWSGMETFFFFYPFQWLQYNLDVPTHGSIVWYEMDTIQEFVAYVIGWLAVGLIAVFPFFALYKTHCMFWYLTRIK